MTSLRSSKVKSTPTSPHQADQPNEDVMKELARLPDNTLCADCKKELPNWVSVTLGIFLCEECAAVHREVLGKDISVVRCISLGLFSMWDPVTVQTIKNMGNKKSNRKWEYRLSNDIERPTATSDKKEREDFIRAKYERMEFCENQQGYLFVKKKNKAKTKKRFCVLDGADLVLLIYKDQKAKDQLGASPSSSSRHKVEKIQLSLFSAVPKEEKDKRKFSMKLVTPMIECTLSASTPEELAEWLNAFRGANCRMRYQMHPTTVNAEAAKRRKAPSHQELATASLEDLLQKKIETEREENENRRRVEEELAVVDSELQNAVQLQVDLSHKLKVVEESVLNLTERRAQLQLKYETMTKKVMPSVVPKKNIQVDEETGGILRKDGVVIAATLSKLVEVLTGPDADTEFMIAFLMTYRSYTTPEVLLDKIIGRFELLVKENSSAPPSPLSPTRSDSSLGVSPPGRNSSRDLMDLAMPGNLLSLEEISSHASSSSSNEVLGGTRHSHSLSYSSDSKGKEKILNAPSRYTTGLESPRDLLTSPSLSDIHRRSTSGTEGESGFHLKLELLTPLQKDRKVSCIRILNVLKHWVQNHYYDFKGNNELCSRLIAFIEFAKTTAEMQGMIDNLAVLLKKRMIGIETVVPIKNNASDSFPASLLPRNLNNFVFDDLDPLEVARQLTLIEYDLFKAILPRELTDQAWQHRQKKQLLAPNLLAMIKRSNDVSGWITTTIVGSENLNDRVRAMERWIIIGQHFREINNYNGLMEIISAFHTAPVQRLKKTFENLNPKSTALLEELKVLMSPIHNSSKYRQAQKKSPPPCLVNIPVYLGDITSIEEGNPDTLQGMINFAKRRRISEVVREIQQYQHVDYKFRPVPAIIAFLADLPTWNEVEAFAASVRAEPSASMDTNGWLSGVPGGHSAPGSPGPSHPSLSPTLSSASLQKVSSPATLRNHHDGKNA